MMNIDPLRTVKADVTLDLFFTESSQSCCGKSNDQSCDS